MSMHYNLFFHPNTHTCINTPSCTLARPHPHKIQQHTHTQTNIHTQVAKYFSTGTTETPQEWYHYALAVPHYTHFTSPIRRFPDIEVHRLLAAVIGEGGSMYVCVLVVVVWWCVCIGEGDVCVCVLVFVISSVSSSSSSLLLSSLFHCHHHHHHHYMITGYVMLIPWPPLPHTATNVKKQQRKQAKNQQHCICTPCCMKHHG